jgi:hypothetical protein
MAARVTATSCQIVAQVLDAVDELVESPGFHPGHIAGSSPVRVTYKHTFPHSLRAKPAAVNRMILVRLQVRKLNGQGT